MVKIPYNIITEYTSEEFMTNFKAEFYEKNLAEGAYPLFGAEDTLKALQGGFRLFLASNGTAAVQERRLEKTGFGKYFEKV